MSTTAFPACDRDPTFTYGSCRARCDGMRKALLAMRMYSRPPLISPLIRVRRLHHRQEQAQCRRVPDQHRAHRRHREGVQRTRRRRSSPAGPALAWPAAACSVGGGVMIALARMKRILEVNVRDRYAVVEPGS